MRETILNAKNNEDSVGGIVETAILNLPAGIGNPLFNSIESYLSSLYYSVPSVKGVEFGDGFNITNAFGSEVNDGYQINNGKIETLSNHNGGILGGITTGMPIIVKCAIKPTPSIGKPQSSVNLKSNENVTLEIKGRHDPAIVNRVVHVINAVTYYGILDLLMGSKKSDWMR
jgi:chorismate synthase